MKVPVSYSWRGHLFFKHFVPILSYLTVNYVFPNLTDFGLACLLFKMQVFLPPDLFLLGVVFVLVILKSVEQCPYLDPLIFSSTLSVVVCQLVQFFVSCILHYFVLE